MGLLGSKPEWKKALEKSKKLERIPKKTKQIKSEVGTLRIRSKRKEDLDKFVDNFEKIKECAKEIGEKSRILKGLNETIGQGKRLKKLIEDEKSIKQIRKRGKEVRATAKATGRMAGRKDYKEVREICERLYKSIKKINQLREMRGRAWEVFKDGLDSLEDKKEGPTDDIKESFKRMEEEAEKLANKKLKEAIEELRELIGEI